MKYARVFNTSVKYKFCRFRFFSFIASKLRPCVIFTHVLFLILNNGSVLIFKSEKFVLIIDSVNAKTDKDAPVLISVMKADQECLFFILHLATLVGPCWRQFT